MKNKINDDDNDAGDRDDGGGGGNDDLQYKCVRSYFSEFIILYIIQFYFNTATWCIFLGCSSFLVHTHLQDWHTL